MAGEKRKARLSTNEKSSKREKKANTSVVSSASNEEIDEHASMHSNASTGESSSPVEETVETNDEVQEVQPIATVDVEAEKETEQTDNSVEPTPLVDVEVHPTNKENRSTTKSWWSSLTRFFHFGYGSNESKTSLESDNDLESAAYANGSYLSNVKPRRNLHDQSLIG